MTMAALYDISIVIPTYQRRDSVRRVLQALAQQTLPPDDYEVIVSIDGSDDGTLDMLGRLPMPYKLQAIWQANQGRAAACNAGIRMATGALVVLLDDDMEPAPEFLAAHLQAHPDGSRLGVMGAVPITVDRSAPPVVAYVGSKFNRHLDQLAQPDHKLKLRDFYSGNFSIRREILLEVGAFDESFKIYGNEDLDLSLRLVQAGVRIVYSPEALARQHYTKDFAGLAHDQIAKGRTAVLLAKKHPHTYYDLKLSTYRGGSRKWRLLRAGLLGFSRFCLWTPDWMAQSMAWLEQRRPARLDLYYTLALDYFYWLGAQAVLRESARTAGGLTSLESRLESLCHDSDDRPFR